MVIFAFHAPSFLPSQTLRTLSWTSLAPYKPLQRSTCYKRATQTKPKRNAHITLSLSRNRAVLSIDVGTSATKAALCFIDRQGQLGALARVPHETDTPADLHVTQRVDDWLSGAIEASRQALIDAPPDLNICALAVTGKYAPSLGVCRHM